MPEKRDFRQEVTDKIIQMLEQGTAPWQKPWDAEKAGPLQLPFNPTTGRPYRGGNAIHLMMTAAQKGYDDFSSRERLAGTEGRERQPDRVLAIRKTTESEEDRRF